MVRKIVSYILKFIIITSAIVGVIVASMGNKATFLYFTTQSNLWIAAVCIIELVLIFLKKQLKPWLYTTKLIFTVSITLTGVVFCGMLAPLLGAGAFDFSSVLLHIIVPVASIADFFVVDYPVENKWWHCLLVTVPPFYYLLFAGIGYAANWDFGYGVNYPYFFLDWGNPAGAFGFTKEFPYMGVFYYVLLICAFVLGVGALYMWLSGVIRRKFSKRNSVE